jgi:hypothetical protein
MLEKDLDIGYIGIVFAAVGRFCTRLRNFFPSPVPQGVAEFEAWSSSIIQTYGFPDNDSVRFALATMILHSGPTAAYASKRYFAVMVKAGAAKQVASQVFTDIKQRQIAAQQQAAATATPVAPNVQPV